LATVPIAYTQQRQDFGFSITNDLEILRQQRVELRDVGIELTEKPLASVFEAVECLVITVEKNLAFEGFRKPLDEVEVS
jgi:hypothetical protein